MMKNAVYLRVLLVLVYVCILNMGYVVSQCTTDNCYDGFDNRSLIAVVSRLQDTVERQQIQLIEMKNIIGSMKQDMARYERAATMITPPSQTQPFAHDCKDLLEKGNTVSGVYDVYLVEDKRMIKVYCDMTTDGGGWLVFQRRFNGSVDFFRDWINYKEGFGNVHGEFWLGNEHLHYLTVYKNYMLRIDMEAFSGTRKYALYSHFGISAESNDYTLSLGEFNGTAGDGLSYHANQKFSTKDRDNDKLGTNCAITYNGAWWYDKCYHCNLNGLYLQGPSDPDGKGLDWNPWPGQYMSLKKVEIKLRP